MHLPTDIDNVCNKATRIWGHQAQEAMVVGEIGELLTMFGRRAQGRDSPEAWVDEIADSIMMLHQLAIIHGKDAVEKRVAEKLTKLKARLAKYECTACNGEGTFFVAEDRTPATCSVCRGTGRRAELDP